MDLNRILKEPFLARIKKIENAYKCINLERVYAEEEQYRIVLF
jgi:hypothetical protein